MDSFSLQSGAGSIHPDIDAASANTAPPGFLVPEDSWDCHAHIFGDYNKYPLASSRQYTPPVQNEIDYFKMLNATGLSFGVLSQPSVYGMDNTALIAAISASKGRLRGVVVADLLQTSDSDIELWDNAGIRGVRLNLAIPGCLNPEGLTELGPVLEQLGWHLEVVLKTIEDLPPMAGILSRLPVPVIIEQMGSVRARDDIAGKAFTTLISVIKDGLWCKLSHAYKISSESPGYLDTLPYARAIIDASSSRLVWGSDWPHPRVPGPMPTDGKLLDLLFEWVNADITILHAILSVNPQKLYDRYRPGWHGLNHIEGKML